MDKFLVSSPTQLSQPFELGGDAGMLRLDDGSLFNDGHFDTTAQHTNSEDDDVTLQNANGNLYHLDNRSHESLQDIVPISNNSRMQNCSGVYNNRFQHSKNISLDGENTSRGLHQASLSTSSMASISQDAPSSAYDSKYINLSVSNNTLYSADSLLQLSSSVSCQSLLDSPTSLQGSQQYQKNMNLPPQNTPRRIGRNKSMSVSSCNNFNAYTTPSRGPNGLNMSPINLMSGVNSKVGKTPHQLKKGHSRSRSRLSIDATNNSLLLNNPSTNPKLSTPAQNPTNNPFYTPSFVDKLQGIDDFGTPLLTPNNLQGGQQRSASYQHLNYLSPAANSWTYNSGSGTSSNQTSAKNNTAFTTPLLLKRNDTLDSIKIEDQDDDAFKQLGKKKSFFGSTGSKSLPGQNKMDFLDGGHTDYKMLEQSLMDKPEGISNLKDDDMFLTAADLSLKLASQLVANPNYEVPQTIVSSNSTPSGINSHNSPSHTFNGSQSIPPGTSYSVPSTTVPSSNDFEIKNLTGLQDFYPNQSSMEYDASGIDLLLPQFNSNRLTDEKLVQSNYSKVNHNAMFTKSYPASIDLASIASPMNSHGFNNFPPHSITYASPSNSTDVLPTMATFSVPSSSQSNQQSPESYLSSSYESKLPIKVSDKTDIIDPKKKHSCPLCQARFQRPEHVKRHLKSHSSEKPYECDEPNCGKRFNRKDNLKAHLKKIHHRKL